MEIQRSGKSGEDRALSKGGRPRNFDRTDALKSALNVFWTLGYEPTSVADLCIKMKIKAPSLYSAFGNKENLFLESLDFYKKEYWYPLWLPLENESDLFIGLRKFFFGASELLLSSEIPCGCLISVSGVNLASSSSNVAHALKACRTEGRERLNRRLQQAVLANQLPQNADTKSAADFLYALLEGLTFRARDNISAEEMEKFLRVIERNIHLLPETILDDI